MSLGRLGGRRNECVRFHFLCWMMSFLLERALSAMECREERPSRLGLHQVLSGLREQVSRRQRRRWQMLGVVVRHEHDM